MNQTKNVIPIDITEFFSAFYSFEVPTSTKSKNIITLQRVSKNKDYATKTKCNVVFVAD